MALRYGNDSDDNDMMMMNEPVAVYLSIDMGCNVTMMSDVKLCCVRTCGMELYGVKRMSC